MARLTNTFEENLFGRQRKQKLGYVRVKTVHWSRPQLSILKNRMLKKSGGHRRRLYPIYSLNNQWMLIMDNFNYKGTMVSFYSNVLLLRLRLYSFWHFLDMEENVSILESARYFSGPHPSSSPFFPWTFSGCGVYFGVNSSIIIFRNSEYEIFPGSANLYSWNMCVISLCVATCPRDFSDSRRSVYVMQPFPPLSK